MAMASTFKVVLGSIAFAIFWVMAVFPAVPFLPIGRTAGALLSAMLMVLFQVITPDEAYDAIDLPILGLLFATMVVSIYLERADMFKYLGRLLSYKSKGGKDLLIRVCLISAISSAFFTNDTTCVVLTEFVLKMAQQNNLHPEPFLLALASSANIGSSATPIGNPQNLVIAVQSHIPFGKFLLGIIPATLLGVVVNVVILLCMYWRLLSHQMDEEQPTQVELVVDEEVISHKFTSVTMSRLPSINSNEDMNHFVHVDVRNFSMPFERGHSDHMPKTRICFSETDLQRLGSSKMEENGWSNFSHGNGQANGYAHGGVAQSLDGKESTNVGKWRRFARKSSAYLVTIGMLAALLMGQNMSWTALTAALILIVLDFKDAMPRLDKVYL